MQADRVAYLCNKQAKVVAMTCTHAALKRREFLNLGLKYDNIVMEEAGQVGPGFQAPEGWWGRVPQGLSVSWKVGRCGELEGCLGPPARVSVFVVWHQLGDKGGRGGEKMCLLHTKHQR